jgi:hypothetical protein
MRHRAIFLMAVLAVAISCGDGGTDPRDQPAVVTEAGVRALLGALAHDSMQGRLAGTVGERRAATFIAARMQSAGLTPAGDSGWFQRVPLRLVPRLMADGRVRLRPVRVASVEALDTVPVERRAWGLNVIGVLPGAVDARRDSALLVTAHYDHLGMGPAVDGDSIYNGADDDASGTVAMLETARLLGATRGASRPARTIVFIAFTAEEQGLIGSQWYASAPAWPLARTIGDLNLEMLTRPDTAAGGPGGLWMSGYERSTMGPMLADAGLRVVPDRRLSLDIFNRSDNAVFAAIGIPAHTLASSVPEGVYHRPSDEASRIDGAHYTAAVRLTVEAARLLASGPAPQWLPAWLP